MNLNLEFQLSLYEELKLIHESKKLKIYIVHNINDDKIYIKKEIKEYTKEIYENIRNIKSKYLAKIYGVFEVEEKLIVIEEYINGETLQDILKREKKIEEKKVIKYMISLCDVLSEIHNLNPPIIHRDIKPSNIMISNDNVLKLIDFDIARTYKDGENIDTTLLGTKGYASPEQFGFDQTDCRSDIYAMGVLMNVLTTGKHIKEKENDTLLKDVIKKCTNISAYDRYENVDELRAHLKEILYKEQTEENRFRKNDYINYNMSDIKLNRRKFINKPEELDNKFGDLESKNKKTKFIERIKNEIPGFRNGNLLNMIMATIFYLFLIFALFIPRSIKELLENIILDIMLLSLFFIYTNFLGIRNHLPFLKVNKYSYKIFGYILYTFVGILVTGYIFTLL